MTKSPEIPSFSAEDALIAVMLAVSAADERMATAELISINRIVDNMPAFGDYDTSRIETVSQTVYDLLEEDEGLEALWGLVREALPEKYNETAYAFACDVAAADGKLRQSELQILEDIRYELEVDRLAAAAIERAAQARHRHP